MLSRNLLKGLLVSFMLLCAAHTWAYDFEVNNIQYTIISLDDLTVEVSGLTDTNVTELVIYGKVEYNNRTLTVTTIGSKAFQSNLTLETVVISDTITTIGSYAFDGCTMLKDLTIGNGITSIDEYTFQGCNSLLMVVIPNSVIYIMDYAFSKCTSLVYITLGKSIESIGDYAFNECSSLVRVDIPNSVVYLGNYSFYKCVNLANITLGNSLESIGSYAFYSCSLLSDITIPDSVTSIGESSFAGCTGISKLTIGNSVERMEASAFKNCSSLTNVVIPNSVTYIGGSVFEGCINLIDVKLGNSVATLGSSAFNGCSNLVEINMPESMHSLGASVFYGCESLKELYIPDNVTSIDAYAFEGCTGLESFSLGTGMGMLFSHRSGTAGNTYLYYSHLYIHAPTQMKSIVLRDCTSSFSTRGYAYFMGSKTTSENASPLFSNIYLEYYYIGRPLTEIKEWSISTQSYTFTANIRTGRPTGEVETLEIGGYCTEVPYFYQSVENLILDKKVDTYEVDNIYQGGLKNIVCESATPPTLSGRFDNSTYINVVLSVPVGYKEVYQATDGWKDFWTIQEVVISGIDNIVNSEEVTEVARYTVSGQRITAPQKGINIVRYSDGSTKKMLVQ